MFATKMSADQLSPCQSYNIGWMALVQVELTIGIFDKFSIF